MIRLVEDISVDIGEVLKFSGEIDFRSAPGFRSMLRTKAQVKCPLLLLDLSEVSYIDSSGMGALVEYWRDAQQFGGRFVLVGLNRRLKEIFHVVHLDEHLEIYDSWEEARDVGYEHY